MPLHKSWKLLLRVTVHFTGAAAFLALSTVFVVLIWSAAINREVHAAFLLDRWPTCEDPAALEHAVWANPALDEDELALLGCRTNLPREAWLYTIRCGADTSKGIRIASILGIDIDWKPVLPENICEIQAWYPGQWVKLFYTYRDNLTFIWR